MTSNEGVTSCHDMKKENRLFERLSEGRRYSQTIGLAGDKEEAQPVNTRKGYYPDDTAFGVNCPAGGMFQ